jgi:hypothetical protein
MREYNGLVMKRLFRIIGSLGWEEGVDVVRCGTVLGLGG